MKKTSEINLNSFKELLIKTYIKGQNSTDIDIRAFIEELRKDLLAIHNEK